MFNTNVYYLTNCINLSYKKCLPWNLVVYGNTFLQEWKVLKYPDIIGFFYYLLFRKRSVYPSFTVHLKGLSLEIYNLYFYNLVFYFEFVKKESKGLAWYNSIN